MDVIVQGLEKLDDRLLRFAWFGCGKIALVYSMTFGEIDGLPLHVYQDVAESVTKPCAEALLTERAAEIILDQGLMPLLSLKDRDAIRLARFQSLADPAKPLAGRWP